MLTPSDLSIRVPSDAAGLHKRPGSCGPTLPTATIVVAEPEAETYLAHGVPQTHLRPHVDLPLFQPCS